MRKSTRQKKEMLAANFHVDNLSSTTTDEELLKTIKGATISQYALKTLDL